MQQKERIKVYIDFKNGETICICKRSKKGCKKKCIPDVVRRDRFSGWQQTCKVDRYGNSKP